MEPGSYNTNTILINITSVPYTYLEPIPSKSKSHLTLLRRIEASWRGKGALVVCDPSKFGIWLFGSENGEDPYSKVATSCTIDGDGGVDTHGFKLRAEARGIFETSALKSPDVFQNQGPGKSFNSMPAVSLEGIRNAQMMNARAAQINSAASIKQGQLPSPVNTTGPNQETSDNAAKIRQLFISAVLGSVSHLLCRNYGLIPLNARTLTNPSRRSISNRCHRFTAPMITLDVALTALGSLTLKTTCQAASALSFVNISSGNKQVKSSIQAGELVWLAGGLLAKYLGPCADELAEGAVASVDFARKNLLQKQHCRTWLVEMGIDASLLEGTWLMISASQANFKSNDILNTESAPLKFPWPAELTFVRHKTADRNHDKSKRNEGFASAMDSRMDGDPLIFAEKWFSAEAERDSNVSKRQQDRDAESAAKLQADTLAQSVATSTFPLATARRNSAAGGVYPTPPDGVQVMTGATPNFDGTSTPGNANQATPMNVDSSVRIKDENSNDLWNSADSRKETQGSEFATNDEGDLFDDMTNDIFGENNITDADFNFFDEPDKMLDDTLDPADNEATDELQQLPAASRHREEDIGPTISMDAAHENSDSKMIDVEMITSSPQNDTLVVSSSGNAHTDVSQGQEIVLFEENPGINATLSPQLVFRRLFPLESSPNVDDSSTLSQHRRVSQFGAIEFESAISDVNGKYSSNGRFGYKEKGEVALRPLSTTIPETEYLNNHHKRQKLVRPKSVLTTWLSSPVVKSEPHNKLVAHDDPHEDILPESGTGSDLSDPDDMSSVSEELPIGLAAGIKRKRDAHDDGDDEMNSSFRDLAVDQPSFTDIDEPHPHALDSDPADWPLNDFFSLPQPYDNSGYKLSNNEYIAAAQILTDQIASSTISNLFKEETPLLTDLLDEKSIINQAQKDLAAVAKRCFNNIEICNVNKFLSIQGFPSINQIMRTPARPQGREGPVQVYGENPFAIRTPHVEVRRLDSKLKILPSAIPLWENLGLGPCKGNKDITAVCVFPAGEEMPENTSNFLERIKFAYELAKLGSHEEMVNVGGPEHSIDSGLLSMDLPLSKKDQILDHHAISSVVRKNCRWLGQALASLSVEHRNLVVYFIYPSDHEEILPLVCSGFYDLYETYKRTLIESRAKVRNELVLQLIPKRFVASSTSVVVPSPRDYARLALEVYDRCTDFQSASCSPSILLEQPLPKSIEFKVSLNPSVSLLDENSGIHVAYAQSIDDRWIAAAWTDNRGSEQMTASYCLGRKSQPISRTFAEIASEIWETTLDIISHKAVNWRIMIAKSGVMDRSEMECWTSLASIEPNAAVTLTLLSIKTRPSLQLLPQTPMLSPTTLSAQPGMLTTPVSTPLSIVSPEQTSTPARDLTTNAPTPDSTPIEPPPADATLIDITDQTWGSILSHRLNNSNSLLDNNPSLLSGYLIKRSGARPEDIPILLEINIIGVGTGGCNDNGATNAGGTGAHNRNARAYEHLLREVMSMYRALGTLARARGVVDSVGDARPWHIAAVEKAVKVLYALM